MSVSRTATPLQSAVHTPHKAKSSVHSMYAAQSLGIIFQLSLNFLSTTFTDLLKDSVALLKNSAALVVKVDVMLQTGHPVLVHLVTSDILAIIMVGTLRDRVMSQSPPISMWSPRLSRITTMSSWDEEFYSQFTALKKRKPSLKIYISVGGWDAGGKVFSDMVRFPGTRNAFINYAIDLMDKYGFDGIDIDWEYPAAEDRDGAAVDTNNLMTFLKNLKSACGDKYGLTVTLPSSLWYLKGFDIKRMSEHIDWFNFMSYGIHSTWDGRSQWTNSVINPHTNMTEISAGLDLLWRNGIDPAKVALGLGFYGRSFTLKDPSCNTPGCAFNNNTGLGTTSGGANPGNCTGTSGILSDYEIARVIDAYSPEVVHDEAIAPVRIGRSLDASVLIAVAGKRCKPGGDEDGDKCGSRQTAPRCTEYVGSSLVNPASTLSTTTSTRCMTITACSAEATTTTTAISSDGPTTTHIEGLFPAPSANSAKWSTMYSSILSRLSSYDALAMPRLTSTTKTATTEKTTTTLTSSTTAPTPSETSYDCKGSGRCKDFSSLRKFCDMAKSFLKDDITYGTTHDSYDSGECYTDGKNAGFGCGVFVKGKNCEMKGRQLAAAYDHIHQESGGGCEKCGSAFFSNGCQVKVDYVSKCKTTNGPLEEVPGPDGNDTVSLKSPSFSAAEDA
ncbi:hypothetical protein BBP40_007695 [Aspergillus hancockii]|nr:hypothetical protein BBP40_007695 [Aspergillus hancockii]